MGHQVNVFISVSFFLFLQICIVVSSRDRRESLPPSVCLNVRPMVDANGKKECVSIHRRSKRRQSVFFDTHFQEPSSIHNLLLKVRDVPPDIIVENSAI
jgi:hypothetical protein